MDDIENKEEMLEHFRYTLLAIDLRGKDIREMAIIHAVGYPEPPTETDTQSLYKELMIDEEFGMTDLVPNKDYVLIEGPEDFIRNFV